MPDNTRKANAAPRCQYVRLHDQPCTQPALQGQPFCRFHDLVDHPLPDARLIPFVEDAATLQLALMQVIRSLQLGQITRPVAGTILYALQISAQNLKHFCEEAGHPFAQPSTRPKPKKDEEDDLPGPSLAEILLERLNLLEEEQSVPQPAAPAAPSGSPGHQIDRSPDASAVIDKLEACAAAPTHFFAPGWHCKSLLTKNFSPAVPNESSNFRGPFGS